MRTFCFLVVEFVFSHCWFGLLVPGDMSFEIFTGSSSFDLFCLMTGCDFGVLFVAGRPIGSLSLV